MEKQDIEIEEMFEEMRRQEEWVRVETTNYKVAEVFA